MMRRVLFFAYGLLVYGMFLGVFLYAIGFIGNFATPTRLDGEPTAPLATALLINTALLAAFAVQHSVMARPAFKRLWTRVVPTPVERSTYCLFSNLALIALFVLWEPIGGSVWRVESSIGVAILYGFYGAGWLLVLVSTFLIDHFDLFGLRQVWLHLRDEPYRPPRFRTPGPYQLVRHPLYVGWLMVFWFTPTMTAAHLLFAAATTAYILIAIRFEERDLVAYFGNTYREYRQRVPMLLPRLSRRRSSAPAVHLEGAGR